MSRQIKIDFSYPFLYKWKQQAHLSVITPSDPEEYFRFFNTIESVQTLEETLKQVNGNYALVSDTGQNVFAAVDRVRSFPLFYKFGEGWLYVTDDISMVEKDFMLDVHAAEIFQKIFCCEGSATLLKGWKQLQAGEFLFYDKIKEELVVSRYFTFDPGNITGVIDRIELESIYLQVFKNILDESRGRPLIVPMSGGYDSRCIVACLQLLGAKHIFCYTYGRKDSIEKKIAEQVAKQLQLDWHFVEYTDELLDIFLSDTWQAYSDKNHHFTSLPHEQDFFALYELKSRGILPENGIVLPGFLGDYFAGSMFKDKPPVQDPGTYQDQYISNRGCKFIVNAVRLYEDFGLEWRLPFSDKNILEYWFGISLEERLYKNGYNDSISDVFFKPLKIDIRKADHEYHPKRIKHFIRTILPETLISYLKSRKAGSPEQDPNNSNALVDKFQEVGYQKLKNMKIGFNEAHARYFLERLAKKMVILEHNTHL